MAQKVPVELVPNLGDWSWRIASGDLMLVRFVEWFGEYVGEILNSQNCSRGLMGSVDLLAGSSGLRAHDGSHQPSGGPVRLPPAGAAKYDYH